VDWVACITYPHLKPIAPINESVREISLQDGQRKYTGLKK
jgi:hypothetical protein